jgi:hypothetical protein
MKSVREAFIPISKRCREKEAALMQKNDTSRIMVIGRDDAMAPYSYGN